MAVRKNSRRRLRREREEAGSTLCPDGKTARRHKYGREVLQDPAAEAGEPVTSGAEAIRSPSGGTDYPKSTAPARGNPGRSNIAWENPGSTDNVSVRDTDLRGAPVLRQDADPVTGSARSPTGHSRKLRSEETASKIRRSRLRMDDAGVDPAGEHVYGGRKPAGESVQNIGKSVSGEEFGEQAFRSEKGLSKDGAGGRSKGTPKAGKAKAGSASKGAAHPEEAAKHSRKLRHPHENTAQKAADATGRAARSADADGNAGVQASVFAEESAKAAAGAAREANYSRKLRKRRREEENRQRLQFESEDSRRMFEGETSDAAPGEKAEHSTGSSGPSSSSNAYSRWRQKQDLKKEYAARRSGRGAEAGAEAAESRAQAAAQAVTEKLKDLGGSASEFIRDHSHEVLLAAAFAVVILVIISLFSSCGMMAGSGSNLVIGTSFTAEDDDILNVEDVYTALEEALQDEIDNIESTHPGYDEYRYTLVEIGHDPYELASLLTVEFEDYTRAEVQARLQEIFEAQYELTLVEEVETRYKIVTLTGYQEVVDPETGKTTLEPYTYEAQVPYQYYILNITLTNRSITEVAYDSGLSDEDLERYEILVETYGNRRDLFEDGSYAYMRDSSGGTYLEYDIPGEALTDTAFANMIAEAEKYLGMAYVWGGSSPETGFDCSGFVCWVINNCGNGWSVGRLTANGLLGVCDIISADEAQPGDLVFFEGTYSTSGASHVGIYVGNGMMIHCGDPISYTSIETEYWQSHLLCFGRITG